MLQWISSKSELITKYITTLKTNCRSHHQVWNLQRFHSHDIDYGTVQTSVTFSTWMASRCIQRVNMTLIHWFTPPVSTGMAGVSFRLKKSS